MSRVGNAQIQIPEGVTVDVQKGGDYGHLIVTVTGPKGTLSESIRGEIDVKIEDGNVNVSRGNDEKQTKAYHGLYRSLINNMVLGVTEGYSKELEIVGIGYRAEQQGNDILFSLGYSHKINLTPPEGVIVTITDQTNIKVEGADKQKVGETAAKIRSFRKPEPYKGKGVKYVDETIKRKSAKNVGA